MFQYQTHTLRPLTTAHLAQTMTLLSLTVDELRQQIDAELSANPALELVDERRCPMCHRVLPKGGNCPVCSTPQNDQSLEPRVYISPRDEFYATGDTYQDDYPEDQFSSQVENLAEYVLRQVIPELESEDHKLAAFICSHFDDDGLLTITPLEVMRYFHVPLDRVNAVHNVIRRADPIGVGSCSTQDALLIQLDVLSETGMVPVLARKIVEAGITSMSRQHYSDLARQMGVTVAKIAEAMRFISDNLNPFPARTHWGDSQQVNPNRGEVYHRPDIIISYLNNDPEKALVVEIIMPIGGYLRVNPLYRQAIKQTEGETQEGLRSDLDRAGLFVKCLQQRNHTIRRMMQKLVMIQRSFIQYGEKSLIPFTRAQMSQDLEVHESTVSRAVTNKTVQLPNGRIVPLSMFFDRSLNERTVLREIIAREARPLSDSELVEMLSREGYRVARRTVAKYRAMEGILPAHLRHPEPGYTH